MTPIPVHASPAPWGWQLHAPTLNATTEVDGHPPDLRETARMWVAVRLGVLLDQVEVAISAASEVAGSGDWLPAGAWPGMAGL